MTEEDLEVMIRYYGPDDPYCRHMRSVLDAQTAQAVAMAERKARHKNIRSAPGYRRWYGLLDDGRVQCRKCEKISETANPAAEHWAHTAKWTAIDTDEEHDDHWWVCPRCKEGTTQDTWGT